MEYKTIDTALKGSKESAQIEARFYADGLKADDINKKQLQKMQEANLIFGAIKEGVNRFAGFNVL